METTLYLSGEAIAALTASTRKRDPVAVTEHLRSVQRTADNETGPDAKPASAPAKPAMEEPTPAWKKALSWAFRGVAASYFIAMQINRDGAHPDIAVFFWISLLIEIAVAALARRRHRSLRLTVQIALLAALIIPVLSFVFLLLSLGGGWGPSY